MNNFADEAKRITDEVLRKDKEIDLLDALLSFHQRLIVSFWMALDMGLVELPAERQRPEPVQALIDAALRDAEALGPHGTRTYMGETRKVLVAMGKIEEAREG